MRQLLAPDRRAPDGRLESVKDIDQLSGTFKLLLLLGMFRNR